MESRIRIAGIHAEGKHGANPGEKDEVQEFVVDLEVSVTVGADALDRTVDYRVLVGAAIEVVEGSSVTLLETLAQGVADAVFQIEGVTRVTALVHKPGAAASLEIDDVAAEATAVG